MRRYLIILVFLLSCTDPATTAESEAVAVSTDSMVSDAAESEGISNNEERVPRDSTYRIATDRREVVNFAKTLIGVPYRYASSNPDEGFDCSGFITYVYKHFNEAVPRSSVDFTHLGREVIREDARPGDLILFTGTDSTDRTVGHMGIVVENSDSLRFIHSTSGKAWGVTITPLNKYYSGRFVKVIDLY